MDDPVGPPRHPDPTGLSDQQRAELLEKQWQWAAMQPPVRLDGVRAHGQLARELADVGRAMRATAETFRRMRELADAAREPPEELRLRAPWELEQRTYDVGALNLLKRRGQEANSYRRDTLAGAANLKAAGGSQNRVQAAIGARGKVEGQRLWRMLERGLLRADSDEPEGLYVDPQVASDDDGWVWLRIWDDDAFDWVEP